MAQSIAATRKQAGLATTTRVYPEAGHALVGTGWAPPTQNNAGPMQMGGTPAATARAQADVFAATWDFLRQHRGPVP